MAFLPMVQKIAERIVETERRRLKLAEFVRDISPQIELRRRVAPDALERRSVAAVDGGIVKRSLHGMDCMLVRAAAVCFRYEKGKVARVDYYPSRNPPPRPDVFEALSEIDWNHFAAISRLKEEVRTAAACLESFQPDVLLLDGLILPHHLDRPARSSPLYGAYEELLGLYRALFRAVKGAGVTLAGVVEDSRNTAFCSALSTDVLGRVTHPLVPELRALLEKTRDSNLLYLILEKGERTPLYPIAAAAADLEVPAMQSFYLKTAQFDRPIKVDFVSDGVDGDALASTLLAISGHHSGYGLPIPLIEADAVAKLSEVEMENFYANILSLTGRLSATMRLRRDQRPF